MPAGRRRLITEREVRHAARETPARLDASDAVVTPSARDLAAQLGVTLWGGATEPAPTAPAATAPASEPAGHKRRIAVGADHGGVALKTTIVARLRELGHEVIDQGTNTTDPVDYPDFAASVARAVASGAADLGVMIDGAGIGSCMAANKIRGVRAAMCYDVTTAVNAREHNHANVLTLGGGLIGPRLALAIVETFIATPFGGGRHQTRVAKIDNLQS
jgi:ribose 5-phosphate isomerase B